MSRWQMLTGDCREVLQSLPAASVDCVITSPPYWRLRDYGDARQTGLEQSPREYAEGLVTAFREVRRVLKPGGTVWLNLGDSYAGAGGGGQGKSGQRANRRTHRTPDKAGSGLKYKDLAGIPWRTALALQDDGWWLRSDVIWHKPNPIPSPTLDRPNSAHEHVFLLAASEVYYYDAAAVREPARTRRSGASERRHADGTSGRFGTHLGRAFPWESTDGMRQRRDVWTVPTQPSSGEHPAPMPEGLVEPCVLAGCPAGGTVLDPFAGSGTVGRVALRLGRRFVGIELVERWADRARADLATDAPLLDLEVTL